MSHFPLVVCIDDPGALEAALVPFDENLAACRDDCNDDDCTDCLNPQARWDWWVTGGRWGGYFPYRTEHATVTIKPEPRWSSPEIKPGYCDGGPKYALDLDRLRDENAHRARETYAEWQKVTAGTPEALPWRVFAENISEGNGYTIDRACEEYHSQPRLKALKETDFRWYDDPIEKFQIPEALYVERQRAQAVPGWAILTTDGRWMEQGKMSWFAMSDATEGSKIGYLEVANAYIGSLPDETWLIAVDCHI